MPVSAQAIIRPAEEHIVVQERNMRTDGRRRTRCQSKVVAAQPSSRRDLQKAWRQDTLGWSGNAEEMWASHGGERRGRHTGWLYA